MCCDSLANNNCTIFVQNKTNYARADAFHVASCAEDVGVMHSNRLNLAWTSSTMCTRVS